MSLGQLVNSNAHTKWAGRPTTRTPHAARTPQSAAIHGHPRPSTAIPGHPGRLAASPSARALPPIPARLSPRRLASPHLTWPTGQFPSPARTQLAAGTGRLPAWPSPCSGAVWPAILRANVLWSESDSWGTPTGPPRPGDRLARPTGQRPLDAHKGPDGLLALTPFEPSQRDLIPDPFLPSSAKSNGQLAYEVGRREGGRDPGSWPGVPSQSPLQPPGAAGPVSGGGV
ncbi:hypothetical protein AtubIFM54640_009415 [Aspergillus tubingensis]|nr:hypothetical protein AtubIFM54640_009415 [Aspergillus tubingensis]